MPGNKSILEEDQEQLLLEELEKLKQEEKEAEGPSVSDIDEELGYLVTIFQIAFGLIFVVFLIITLIYFFSFIN